MKFNRIAVFAGFIVALTTAQAQADVRVQCRNFSGEPIIEVLFQEAPAFAEETRAPWDEFTSARERFVPGPAREFSWSSFERLHGIDHLVRQHLIYTSFYDVLFSVDPQGALSVEFHAAPAALHLRLENYYERIGDEVYYGAREWEEDGGLLFGTVRVRTPQGLSVDSTKVLCGANIQGHRFDPLPNRWRHPR